MHQNYWSKRWQNANTPWDMGTCSPPLTAYLQQLYNQQQAILIPGAGNGYEFMWLHKNGFNNTVALDIAAEPLKNLAQQMVNLPTGSLIQQDFFAHSNTYDLIIEQTFFCALPTNKRAAYAEHMHKLLKPNGKLVGVWFNFPLNESGPPFGGSKEEYASYFKPYFKLHKIEPCYNSIKPRAGKELFLSLLKA